MKTPKLMHGWEVEWCYELPRIEGTTDADMDAAKFATADFATREAAVEFAKSKLPIDRFGAVRVTEFEMREYEPGVRAWYREHIKDSEEVSE